MHFDQHTKLLFVSLMIWIGLGSSCDPSQSNKNRYGTVISDEIYLSRSTEDLLRKYLDGLDAGYVSIFPGSDYLEESESSSLDILVKKSKKVADADLEAQEKIARKLADITYSCLNYPAYYDHIRIYFTDEQKTSAGTQEFEYRTETLNEPYFWSMVKGFAEDNESFREGRLYLREGSFQKAIDAFTEAIDEDSELMDAFELRAEAYRQISDYNAAIDDYDKLISYYPQIGQYHLERGKVYYEKADFQEALDNFDYAVYLNENDPECYLWRGKSYGELDDYYNALRDYNKITELRTFYPDAYLERGKVKSTLGLHTSACEDFEQARIQGIDSKKLTPFLAFCPDI